MITPNEVMLVANSIKTTIDIAKGYGTLKSDVDKNLAISNIVNHLIEVQNNAIQLQNNIFTILNENQDLKEQIDRVSRWDEIESKYELIEICEGCFVYMERVENGKKIPKPYFCANCFSKKKLSILQKTHVTFVGIDYECSDCKTVIRNDEKYAI